jgi:hypothetical protein
LFFPIREQKEKSEMKRESRTGRKGRARPPKPSATTVSFPSLTVRTPSLMRRRLPGAGSSEGTDGKK